MRKDAGGHTEEELVPEWCGCGGIEALQYCNSEHALDSPVRNRSKDAQSFKNKLGTLF